MIGNFLKQIRQEQKIRVAELAEKVGVSQPYMSNIENEKRSIGVDMFFRIIYAMAELSPINSQVENDLNLSDSLKVELHSGELLSILPEFWEEYSSEIKKELNQIIKSSGDWITSEDLIETESEFISYVQSFDFDTLLWNIPHLEEWLDKTYGVGKWVGYYDYDNPYSQYINPEDVKEEVKFYWYQEFLSKLLQSVYLIKPNSIINPKKRALQDKATGVRLSEHETTIFKEVYNLLRQGHFIEYKFPEVDKDNLDLSVLFNDKLVKDVLFDGKPLTVENINSIRNTLNGIRFERLN